MLSALATCDVPHPRNGDLLTPTPDNESVPTTSTSARGADEAPRAFYGWRIVAMSVAVYAMSAPGQTAGISASIDPLIRDLGVSRTQISTSYLIGTLAGAAALPLLGNALDRYGIRRVLTAIAAVFGAVLIALSAVTEIVGLTAGFAGIRAMGQGALTLAASTAVALWFDRRRGFALGLSTALGMAAISLAPVLFERLVSELGWRTAWFLEGLAVWVVVLPIALLGMRDRPADLGQHPDGVAPAAGTQTRPWGWTRAQAARTGMFWVFSAGVATSSMLVTALAFHQISLLGERGLSPAAAAANFLPQTAATLLATLGVGALVDRVAPRLLLPVSMVLLSAALLWARVADPGLSAIGLGLTIGAAAGSVQVLGQAAFPRYYGVAHVGAIRGIVTAVGVGASAVGPLLFALGRGQTGSYAGILLVSAAVPLVVAIAVLLTPPPRTVR